MENRPRTRRQNEHALIRRYTEWKKERESDSGGNSSKFGFLETSSENVNVKLGLNGSKLNNFGQKGKRVNRVCDDNGNFNNVETLSYLRVGKKVRKGRGVKSDIVVAAGCKKNGNSGSFGCTMKRIEKNKIGVKRNNDEYLEHFRDWRKNCKYTRRVWKKPKSCRTNVDDDVSENGLDTIDLSDDDIEEEDRIAESVGELKTDKKYNTRSKKANNIVNFGVSDDKSEDRARDSFRKGVVNPKEIKGLCRKDDRNTNVAEMSDDIDDTDDDVQIIDVNYGYTVNSVSSSSGKGSSTKVVLNYNTSQYKGKDGLASPSQKRDNSGCLKDGNSIEVSNQGEKHMGDTNKLKGVKEYAPIIDSSEELSESGNTSSSDLGNSSESLYEENAESPSSDEHSYDDDNECRDDDVFVTSHDSSSVGEEKKVDEHEKESRPKEITVEAEAVRKFHEREVTEETSSVAERLRRRRCSKATEIAKVKMDSDVTGTSSCPFTLSDDEINVFPEEDVDLREETTCPEVRDNGKDGYKDNKEENKVKKKLGRPARNMRSASISVNKILVDSVWDKGAAQLEKEDVDSDKTACHEVSDNRKDFNKDTEEKNKGKRKRGRPPKKVRSAPVSVKKILVESIWEKGDAQMEKLITNPPDGATALPLKFWFDDSDMELSDTSDIEAETLFEEMNYCMGVVNVGGSDSVMVDSMESIASNINMDPACGCLGGGDHHLVLDEQIGLRCTICHLVIKEISNILPDFSKHQGGRSEARDFYRMDYSNFDAVQIEDFTSSQLLAFNGSVQTEGTVWDLVPGVRNGMYPHQREGFEFIWKNIAGSIFVEEAKKSISDGVGSGCIISHAPGTGKTRLTIMFLQTYMQLNSDCRPLIIAPCSMLLTWEEEFRKWNVGIPFHNLNSLEYSGQESARAVSLQKNDRRQGNDLDSTRLVKLFSWKTEKSVLGISYQLFEELASISVLIDRGKREGKGKSRDNDTAEQIRKMLLLLPGLLVLDEGHIPRNRASQIWKALSEVQTERRIMLSGTPFQNNFDELLNTFCMVRPKFSDEIISQTPANGTEKRRRIKTAAKGKWALMTNKIGKDDDQKLEELKKIISDFVHVYKGNILKEKLPGLRDFVVVLSPNNLQRILIELVGNSKKNFFKRENLRSLISVHPALFSFDDLSEKEAPLVRRAELERIRLDPNEGVKTKFLVELIRLSWALKERVLIFSQYLKPLKLIMKQLRKQFHWAEGKEILYIGGEHSDKERQLSINKLNDPKSESRVLLASSRACSEGINLVGASRVVLLDVVWNPSITRQSTSRAYRLGQKKVVHVYHLIAGTWEWKKFARQAGKDRLSDLVFSSKEGVRKPDSSCSVAEDKILQDMVESMSSIFVKILNQPKESDLIDTFG